MPTELEELLEFLHHGNTQVRQLAAENLVPYSEKEPAIFKTNQLTPIKDLKLLIRDYAQIARNALTILINISKDRDVLHDIANDDPFLESVLNRITNAKEPNANEMAMLLANMAKEDSMERILTLQRDTQLSLSKSKSAIDQLTDCFVKGATNTYNPHANYDYLAYLFADLAKFPSGATYFTDPRPYDSIHPISKLLPFTTHPSLPRRLGVSTTLKNTAFALPRHPTVLSPSIDLLPYILLPLASGSDNYSTSETDQLLPDLQLLDESHKREKDNGVLVTHLETLLLLTTTREGRDRLREAGTYFVVRECHLAVEDEGVREGAERLVQVLMRDEEGEEGMGMHKEMHVLRDGEEGREIGRMVTQVDEVEDEDEKVVEIF